MGAIRLRTCQIDDIRQCNALLYSKHLFGIAQMNDNGVVIQATTEIRPYQFSWTRKRLFHLTPTKMGRCSISFFRMYVAENLFCLWRYWTTWNRNLVDNGKGIRRGLRGNFLKQNKIAIHSSFWFDSTADSWPTIILHEAIDLREIANTSVGQNGIIVWQASARAENLSEQAIRVAIRVRIIIEKSAKSDLISPKIFIAERKLWDHLNFRSCLNRQFRRATDNSRTESSQIVSVP